MPNPPGDPESAESGRAPRLTVSRRLAKGRAPTRPSAGVQTPSGNVHLGRSDIAPSSDAGSIILRPPSRESSRVRSRLSRSCLSSNSGVSLASRAAPAFRAKRVRRGDGHGARMDVKAGSAPVRGASWETGWCGSDSCTAFRGVELDLAGGGDVPGSARLPLGDARPRPASYRAVQPLDAQGPSLPAPWCRSSRLSGGRQASGRRTPDRRGLADA